MPPNIRRVILVVDDEPMITGPLERLIDELISDPEDYEILPSNDPVQILEEIKTDNIEVALVISDLMMPEMKGDTFLEEVKKIYPLAPRIILSGFGDKDDVIKAINELGLSYYVEKPWDNDFLATLIQNALEQYRRAKMEAMFGLYVPREIVEEFINKSDKTVLEGQTLHATVLFLDIVNFTPRTENMDAQSVVRLLNKYYSEIVDIIKDHGGILDKFIGDGLMALFGVPKPTGVFSKETSMDARNAILSALDMVECIARINECNEDTRLDPIRVRIGINTGEVMAGNIGSTNRVNYTVVGDVVNTAKRIEDVARDFIEDDLSCILISRSAYEEAKDTVQGKAKFDSKGPMQLKGRKEKVHLYKVTR